MSTHSLIKRRAVHILVAALALAATPVASAATPSWYPQLRLAVLDVSDAATAVGTCKAPHAATPKAGRSCAVVHATEESADFNRVSTFAEIGQDTGPCRPLLLKLDQAAVSGAAKTLTFATSKSTSVTKEMSGRRAVAKDAAHMAAEFALLKHCLGKA